MLAFWLFTFVCAGAHGAQSSAETAIADKIRSLNERYAKRAEKIYLDSTAKTSTLTVQEIGNTALYLCMSQADQSKIEHLLRTEFGAQMMDDTYPTFGQLPSRINSSDITNNNSLELGCQALGPILIGYDNRLSPNLKKWLEPHLKAAMIALRKQNVPVKNTSACLIKAVDLILIGTAIYDGEAIYDGTRLLDDWIAYTKQSGIHEFNSPQAYEQDLNALNMGYLFAPDKLSKSKFKAVLDYFWQDISAHYYPPIHATTGARGRDYDLLFGGGAVDNYASLAGLASLPSPVEYQANEVYMLLNAVDTRAYRPAKNFLDLATTYPRTVECRWDDSPANDTYTYITRDYSLGSASGGNFGITDKMLVAHFGFGQNLNVTFGTVLKKTGIPRDDKRASRFNEHGMCEPYVVQSQNKILALLKIDTSKLAINDELTTEFVFPYGVHSIYQDERKVNIETLLHEKANKRGVKCLGVRGGEGAFILKVFQADSMNDDKVPVEVTATAQDWASGVFKVSIKHGRKQAKSPKFLKLGFVMVGAHCSDDVALLASMKQIEDASIKQRLNDTGWQVDAQIEKTLLTINRDFVKPADTTRFVNGIEVQSPVFSVNGTLLGPSMWRHEDALLQRQSVSE